MLARIILGMVLALALAPVALGNNGIELPPYNSMNSAYQNSVQQRVLLWPETGLTADAEAGLYDAAVGGGAELGLASLPAASVIGVGVLGGAAFYTGWKVGSPLGGFVYRKIVGDPYLNNTPPSDVHFVWVKGSTASQPWTCGNQQSPANVGGGGFSTCALGTVLSNYWFVGTGGESPAGFPDNWGVPTGPYGARMAQMGPLIDSECSGGVTSCSSTSGNCCFVYYVISGTELALRHMKVTGSDATAFGAANRQLIAGTEPTRPSSLTATQAQAALDAIASDHSSGRSAKHDAAVQKIVDGAGGNTNVGLLQPIPNETYSAYIARLQAAGLVGVYTSTLEPVSLDGYGPNAVTRVQYYDPSTSTFYTLDPLRWPSPIPSIAYSTALTIRYNPSTSTPAPNPTPSPTPTAVCGTTALGACQVQDTSTGPDNAIGTIDWTPIESISFGSKFPFGFFSWIGSFFGSIPTSGTCPTLHIGKPAALGGGTQDISFCSATWESTWRSPVFLVLEALMTLAGVIFLAQRILGFGSDDE